MASDESTNSYEEARKLRLQENNKRFEDLGIKKISKCLSELSNSQKKPHKQRLSTPRPRNVLVAEPRRSTRERNPIKTYSEEVDIDISFRRKRSLSSSSSTWATYLARPIEEVKSASIKQRSAAYLVAEELQKSLETDNPCFIKSMLRSHVYSCFWLGLPFRFCEDHLPKSSVEMKLVDEDGEEYGAVYIGRRSGLSGGWRGFALEHKLDDGDALVFELVEPTKFKVYIVRVSMLGAKDETTDAKEKLKTATLGFKQKKKSNAGKTNGSVGLNGDGLVKDEGEPGTEDKAIGCAEKVTEGIRRSSRKRAW